MILKNKKTLKQRLADGEILFGTFFKFNAPQLAEMLGYAGMDFIIVDGEHGDCSYSEMANVVRAANSVGMDAIVRVPNALDQNILHAIWEPKAFKCPIFTRSRRRLRPFARCAMHLTATAVLP